VLNRQKILIALLVVSLFIFGNSKVEGADWKLLVDNKNADVIVFYDSDSLASSENSVRVWIKLVYKTHEFKDYEKQLFELNCKEKRFRVLEEIIYLKEGWSSEKDEKNERLQKRSLPSNWQFVEPDTVGMVMHKKFCH
jgi:hypothetical protein